MGAHALASWLGWCACWGLFSKGGRMKVFKNIRPKVVVVAIATSFVFSPLSFASDKAQLAGKDLGQNRTLLDSVMNGRNYVVEVDRLGKIKQVVDAGATGSGKDAQPPIAGASPTAKTSPAVGVSSVGLPINYQGQDAIDYIGADLPKIAESHGLTQDKLKELLLTDSTVHIDKTKHIFYVDESLEQQLSANPSAAGAIANGALANSPALPIGLTPTTANAFSLHSKPGASKTIYLDFDGYAAVNTAWARSTTINAPAYDLDGNPDIFNDNELTNIVSIWSRVAEDYIPFDIDVTTKVPSGDALLRSSTTDTTYGTQVVITKTGTVSCSCGGVAYIGVVAQINNTAYQPAWVFQQSLANNEKYIAEAVSHEAGHTLGLVHDGQKVGATVNAYYSGHGAGVTGWAPIMGVGYYKNATQWSNGVYPNANNKQDDFAVLASNGFTQRPDDTGNTFTTATSLSKAGSGTTATIQATGVIETANDVDMYRIDTAGGLINFTAKPTSTGPNLDTKLTLFKANGATVSTNAPEPILPRRLAQPSLRVRTFCQYKDLLMSPPVPITVIQPMVA
jgi:Metallo-peptidase family M12B Reprolysin-like